MRTVRGIVGKFKKDYPITTFDRHILKIFDKTKNKQVTTNQVYQVFGESIPTDRRDVDLVMRRRRKDFASGITDEDFKILSQHLTMTEAAKALGLVYHTITDRARHNNIVFVKKAKVGHYPPVEPVYNVDTETRKEALSLLKSGDITQDEFRELMN